MDDQRFDRLAKLLSTKRSRRGVVTGAALGGLVAAAGFAQVATAARCKKVDKPCRRDGQCCSGICGGKRRKKRCRGHGEGTCKQDQDYCTASDPRLTICNNNSSCVCVRTTSGTSFCHGNSDCADCDTDADCVKLGFPAGSACIVGTQGRCAGLCENGRFCAVRCGVAWPPPE